MEEEVPVHGDGDGAFVVLPGGVQVRPGQVGGIKSPSRLRSRHGGIVDPGMASTTLSSSTTKPQPTPSPPSVFCGTLLTFCFLLDLIDDIFGVGP